MDEIKELAIQVIEKESAAVLKLKDFIDQNLVDVVDLMYHNSGRVVVTGIGKSAIIATKMVATFNSTGTPALFMHAADAIHGDLGMIQPSDIVICLSKSGDTPEIKVLVPLIKTMGNKLVAIVSNPDSYLARQADYRLLATVDGEACPHNLAPTSSTTTQLVMGDVLAVCLLQKRGFKADDFARVHPGGALGKKLYIRVSDLFDSSRAPSVNYQESLQKTIFTISSNRLGATAVLDDNGALCGVITDGDIRRMVERGGSFGALRAKELMNKDPKTIDINEMAINAFRLMEEKKITQLIVLKEGDYVGMIHIHDIMREGIV
ncbi:MAG: KpsF/GutQ family sugar-phosphate isomerase [Bacteroidetes bacterium]|nr:KpsF/GutQ family sugar-phosphate isomerase [Bacteroidota bacterium]